MSIIAKANTSTSFLEEITHIREIIKGIENKTLSMMIDNRCVSVSPFEFTYAYARISPDSSLSSPLRKLFIDAFRSLDVKSPASGFFAAKALVQDSKITASFSVRLNSQAILDLLATCLSKEEMNILRESLLAGALYKSFEIKESQTVGSHLIQSHDSKKIEISLDKSFQRVNDLKTNGFLIFYDAVIENMSEIDNLIQSYQKNKIPIFLVCRGFLPEVSSTLHHNFLNKKLKIFPCEVNLDDHDPFRFEDSCEILGLVPVAGRLSAYSSFEFSVYTKFVDNIEITGNLVKIPAGDNLDMASSLIEKIKKQLKAGCLRSNQELKDHSILRMKRALGSHVNIHLAKGTSGITRSRIRKGIILYRQLSRHGTSKTVQSFPLPSFILKNVKSTIEKLNQNVRNIKFLIKV